MSGSCAKQVHFVREPSCFDCGKSSHSKRGLNQETSVTAGGQLTAVPKLKDQIPHTYSKSQSCSCRWTGSLGSFLDHLCRHFSKRVVSEQSPGSYEDTTDDESDAEPMQLDPPAVANGTNGANKPRAKLSAETQQRVSQLITKLASRAQYAKV